MKGLEAKWEKEKAMETLQGLMQQASKEYALDPSLGVSTAFGGGKTLCGPLPQEQQPPPNWNKIAAGVLLALAVDVPITLIVVGTVTSPELFVPADVVIAEALITDGWQPLVLGSAVLYLNVVAFNYVIEGIRGE